MVAAAAAAYGIFLCQSQAGDGFAGVEKAGLGVGDGACIAMGSGRCAREQLQEVEGAAFAGEESSHRALQAAELLLGGDLIAILNLPFDSDRRVDLAIDFIKPGLSADDGRFTHDDSGLTDAVGGE